MKSITKLLMIGVIAQCALSVRADARGELPPPPPFPGGNAGDWLGSGLVFGFEPPSAKNPWVGVGGGSGGIGGGGANGGWGGAWWGGAGPLGGGRWGGWGGWGSGLGATSGNIDSDTSKKGYLWPFVDQPLSSCWTETEAGIYSDCKCVFNYDLSNPPQLGNPVTGTCLLGGGHNSDPQRLCPGINAPCRGEFGF